jgi:hypothetical protein
VTTLATSQSLLDQPGTVAFLVIFGMAVVCLFLFRSMSKHLRKVSDAARAEAEEAARAAAGEVEEDRPPKAGPTAGDNGQVGADDDDRSASPRGGSGAGS